MRVDSYNRHLDIAYQTFRLRGLGILQRQRRRVCDRAGRRRAEQHANCVDIEWDEVQPGDLLFYPEDEHVGIAAGRDWLGRLLVVHCASGTDGVAISHRTGFETAARPVWYTDE